MTIPLAILGVAAAIMVVVGFTSRLRTFQAVDLYFASYLGIVLVWPFYQTRFWLGVVPLMFGYFVLGLDKFWGWRSVRMLTWLGGLTYLALGVTGLIYGVWLTFSGDQFYTRYGSRETQAAYRTHFEAGYSDGAASSNLLRVLNIYYPKVDAGNRD